jgi:hypothetical protein
VVKKLSALIFGSKRENIECRIRKLESSYKQDSKKKELVFWDKLFLKKVKGKY